MFIKDKYKLFKPNQHDMTNIRIFHIHDLYNTRNSLTYIDTIKMNNSLDLLLCANIYMDT